MSVKEREAVHLECVVVLVILVSTALLLSFFVFITLLYPSSPVYLCTIYSRNCSCATYVICKIN
jgi:hypothetical protein